MKKAAIFSLLFLALVTAGWAQTVKIVQNDSGWEMLVDNKQFFVKGVQFAINPPGTSFNYVLWNESDATIRKVLDTEGALMAAAGINAIRVGPDIPRKWIEYLYNNHGIYTIIHDTFSRWGATANGRWYNPTNYYVPEIRENIRKESRRIVETYMNATGVLMFMFGDGNGDGLYWSGNDNTPEIMAEYGIDPRFRKARALFTLLEEVFAEAKETDPYHPVGFVTNDLGWVELVSEICVSMDFLGVNINRGMEAGESFWRDAKQKIEKPVVVASIGCDAWNAKTAKEDQGTQAEWITSQWKDIYKNAYGNGYANALGGCVNEWTDQWYKRDYESVTGAQTSVHDTEPTGKDEGFWYDYTYGELNMTPEWNGITSQGEKAYVGRFREKRPRAAYYALQHIWSRDPWYFLNIVGGGGEATNTGAETGEEVSSETAVSGTAPAASTANASLDEHFARLNIAYNLIRGQSAVESFPKWGVDNQVTVTAMQSGDDIQKTLKEDDENLFTAFKDNQWGVTLKSTFWGKTGNTGIGELEGAATVMMRHDALVDSGPVTSKIERTVDMGLAERPIDIYQGWFSWKGFGGEVNAHYHHGKPGWMGEGDFFNLNTETYDLFNNDVWDIKANISVEGRYNFGLKGRQGLAVIAGPRIYAYGKPMILGKWYQEIAIKDHDFAYSVMAGQGFASLNTELGEYGEPGEYEKPLTQASLYFSWKPWLGFDSSFRLQLGAMMSNLQKVDEEYFVTVNDKGEAEGGTIGFLDTLSAKINVEWQPISYFKLQAEAVHAGLVADTNYVPALMSTIFADIGTGNRLEGKLGLTGAYGNWGLAINGLYRRPYQAAIDPDSLKYLPGALPLDRTIHDNPFSVGGNREMISVEAILSFDLEPSSWLWEWNVYDTESAPFAGRLRGRYNFFEGATDPGYRKGADGKRRYYDLGFPETTGNYDLGLMLFYNQSADLRIANSVDFTKGYPFGGVDQTIIDEDRTQISGWSDTLKIRYKRLVASGMVAFDLWGPVSTDRENNRTYPLRWSFDLAFGLTPKPSLTDSSNRVGVRWNGVIRDRYSTNAEIGRDTQELILYFDYTF